MDHVRVLFCRNHHISTPLLRLAMWSPWSHVALITDDDHDGVVDATFIHGVARRSLSKLVSEASHYEIVNIRCPSPKAAYEWARSQIGKPYDTLGVLGIGLHRDWSDDDAWFCSEFVEAALAAGGNRRFRPHIVRRVTPMHSYMVEPDLLLA
jgi:uncharacterized protein YycO